MNYFYDVTVNFQEDNFNYFEWLKSDELLILKKVPVFLISKDSFLEIYNNVVKIDELFLKEILKKTICKVSEYCNCVLLCDKSNCIIIAFDEDGQELKRSSLCFNDDETICEMAYSLKKIKINYQLIKEIKPFNKVRKLEVFRNNLIKEFELLYKNKEYYKIKYLYYEMYNIDKTDLDFMYNELVNFIKNISKYKDYQKIIDILNYPIV